MSSSKLKFDKFGRPMVELESNVCDPNTDFYLNQPEINFLDRMNRFKEHSPSSYKFISPDEFENRIEDIRKKVLNNDLIVSLEKHEKIIRLPIYIPPQEGVSDPGKILEEFLEIAKRSYEAEFSSDERIFTNHRKGNLGKVDLVGRQETLQKKLIQGLVAKIYICFQGCSINYDREVISYIPEEVILSGLDLVVAIGFFPDVLGRDRHTPGLDFAGLKSSSGRSFSFWAHDDAAGFDDTACLSHAYVDFAGAVAVLG